MLFSFHRGEAGTGGRLIDIVMSFFEEDGWHFERVDDDTLTMGFSGDSGTWRCGAVVNEEQDRFAFFSVLDTKVSPERRAVAAEYITRANFDLVLGNFEMDYSDGEVRFKTSIDVEGGGLTHTMIRNMVYTNCALMDRYMHGLLKVVYGDVSPELAIQEAEQTAS